MDLELKDCKKELKSIYDKGRKVVKDKLQIFKLTVLPRCLLGLELLLPIQRVVVILILSCLLNPIRGSPIKELGLIPLTSCPIQLSSCPMDADSINTRSLCMNNFSGCSAGSYYLCGTTNKYIIESCQPGLSCQPGTSYQYVVDQDTGAIHLECLPCTGDRFEPDQTDSSRSSYIRGCTYQHLPQGKLSGNLVLYREGSASTASLWICNYEKDFYERDGNMFCNDVPTHSCTCVQKTCKEGHLLRPDGACIPCLTRLLKQHNFSCYDPQSQGALEGENDAQRDHVQPSVETGKSNSLRWLAIGVAVLIAAAAIIGCFFYRRHTGRRTKAPDNESLNDLRSTGEDTVLGETETAQNNIQTSNNHGNVNNFVGPVNNGLTLQTGNVNNVIIFNNEDKDSQRKYYKDSSSQCQQEQEHLLPSSQGQEERECPLPSHLRMKDLRSLKLPAAGADEEPYITENSSHFGEALCSPTLMESRYACP